jgi:hypothetical protein
MGLVFDQTALSADRFFPTPDTPALIPAAAAPAEAAAAPAASK